LALQRAVVVRSLRQKTDLRFWKFGFRRPENVLLTCTCKKRHRHCLPAGASPWRSIRQAFSAKYDHTKKRCGLLVMQRDFTIYRTLFSTHLEHWTCLLDPPSRYRPHIRRTPLLILGKSITGRREENFSRALLGREIISLGKSMPHAT